MESVIVVYPPGAGGNHVKNMLCLNTQFANSHELDLSVYDISDLDQRPPGEVWCVPGRNVQPMFIDRMLADRQARYVMPAHFGELAPWRDQLRMIDPKIILITMNQQQDRDYLMERQTRLGQHIHPYWLDEELTWCYQPLMLQCYFEIVPERVFSLSLSTLWSRDFVDCAESRYMARFLALDLPISDMTVLHHKWWDLNFDSVVDNTESKL